MVPKAGLEPARDHSQRILSPSRLPIPSLRRKKTLLDCRNTTPNTKETTK